MTLLRHAEKELDLLGMTEDNADEMDIAMRNHILHMVEEFSNEGHSGFSASFAIAILEKLLRYEPITPLTGDDSEWMEVGDGIYQNNRCSHVFKENGQAYDINGIIFYDVLTNENGKEYKNYFTNSDSKVNISFPYLPKREYKERVEVTV